MLEINAAVERIRNVVYRVDGIDNNLDACHETMALTAFVLI